MITPCPAMAHPQRKPGDFLLEAASLSSKRGAMKIALVCTGLGNVRRGYEKFTEELFRLLRDDVDITLFKGGGRSAEGEVVIPNLRRDGWFRHVPFVKSDGYRDAYYYEVLSFGAVLLPHLMSGKYDILHYVDPTLGNLYFHTRSAFRFEFRFKTLLTNAIALPPEHCARANYVHHASPVQHGQCLLSGFAEERMALIPLGVNAKAYQSPSDRLDLRRRWDIPQDKFVILAVAAINRGHKRVDYLIEETAKLGPECFLVVVGHLEDPSLVATAADRLPARHKMITRPLYGEIAELYGLADVAVSASLTEGFGLGIVEAMCSGLPVLTHDNTHFRWLAGQNSCHVDMEQPGALAARLRQLSADREGTRQLGESLRGHACQRFDWSNLKKDYIDMYSRIYEQSKSNCKSKTGQQRA